MPYGFRRLYLTFQPQLRFKHGAPTYASLRLRSTAHGPAPEETIWMNPAVQTDRETRRTQVIESLADAVATLERAPPVHVAVDGLTDPVTRTLADDLARLLASRGRRCRRVTLDTLSLLHPAGPGVARPSHRGGPGDDLVVVVDGCFLQHPEFLGAWDLVIFLRSGPPQPAGPYEDPDQAAAATRYLTQIDPENIADIVVDLHDPGWPVIRRIDPPLADRLDPQVFLAETRAFFAPRAATWEQRFPDDDPAYAAAVAEVGLHPGQTAVDVGCGTGRALPHLRTAVGPDGRVLGFDLTPQMLATARGYGRNAHALLVMADARRLPLPAASVDGAFAAGLLPHLPDPGLGLTELARVTVPDGRLVLFHPSGRAALAARHGRRLRQDDLLALRSAPPAPGPHGVVAGPLRRRPRPLPRHRLPGSRTHR
jgi:SAM-dependent methyltransferase